jgi:hypothetical protein
MADCEDCAKLGKASAAGKPHARLIPRALASDGASPVYDCAACGAKWQRHSPDDAEHEPQYWRRFYEDD